MQGKFVTVAKLEALLAELPSDFMIAANVAGNLLIRDAVNQYHGYIDLEKEKIEVSEEST